MGSLFFIFPNLSEEELKMFRDLLMKVGGSATAFINEVREKGYDVDIRVYPHAGVVERQTPDTQNVVPEKA